MKRLKTIVAILLLALWTPVSSHCLLEAADLLPELLHCADACAPGGESDGDACASIESAAYKSEDNQSPLVAGLLTASVPGSSAADRPASPPAVFLPRPLAAPELPATWRFSFRAAAPPRAPTSPA